MGRLVLCAIVTKQDYWINRTGLLRYRFTIETPTGHIEGRRLTHGWAKRAARRKIHKIHTRAD